MKTSTIILLGVGAAAALYFVMRSPQRKRPPGGGGDTGSPDALTAGIDLAGNLTKLGIAYFATQKPADTVAASFGSSYLTPETYAEGY